MARRWLVPYLWMRVRSSKSPTEVAGRRCTMRPRTAATRPAGLCCLLEHHHKQGMRLDATRLIVFHLAAYSFQRTSMSGKSSCESLSPDPKRLSSSNLPTCDHESVVRIRAGILGRQVSHPEGSEASDRTR
mmetsp:Transcript_28652/g.52153  ORF Transcript_28652/g.52153 Transcript_28652/m.52153 type:complete len:131 (+) Transcript_28652:389-781(+)